MYLDILVENCRKIYTVYIGVYLYGVYLYILVENFRKNATPVVARGKYVKGKSPAVKGVNPTVPH